MFRVILRYLTGIRFLVKLIVVLVVSVAVLRILLYYNRRSIDFNEEKIECSIPQPKYEATNSKPLKCSNYPDWITIRDGKLEFRRKNLTCQFQEILRPSDQSYGLASTVQEVQHGASAPKQFMAFDCVETIGNISKSHKDHHMYVIRDKPLVEAKQMHLNKMQKHWNVYIVAFDSISRVQFEALAPKTIKFLKNQMKAIVLQQYNVAGDGTTQAFIPILTGKTELELPLTRKRYKNASFMNVYPFVWNDFAKKGYYTSYAEDDIYSGTYQYRLKGFDKQPTDFYPRPFYQRTFQHSKSPHCLGGETQQQKLFDIGEGIFRAYPDLPKFVLSFSGMTHDKPILDLIDDDLFAHLKEMWNRYHNETIFIIMADHGPRYGTSRSNYDGKLRELLPFMSISLPPLFKALHPNWTENLKVNTRKLTSPFDIHATLLDILDGSSKLWKQVVEGRSLSLFGKIPSSRTCSQAGVLPFFCGCLKRKRIKVDTPVIASGVKKVLAEINRQTEPERKQCVKLELNLIVSASKSEPEERMLKFKKTVDYDGFQPDYSDRSSPVDSDMYEAKFSTKPGNNVYEGYFTVNSKTGSIYVDINQVSSVTAYGDSPHCVLNKNEFLRQWCVCYDKTG